MNEESIKRNYDRGQKYPFMERAPKTTYERASCAILADLNDRRGVKTGFWGIDSDIREEIVETMAGLIEYAIVQEVIE